MKEDVVHCNYVVPEVPDQRCGSGANVQGRARFVIRSSCSDALTLLAEDAKL
jgi:hypothetical protein